MNIFVARLDYAIQESELRTLFEEYGEVTSVKVIMDKLTGRSKGFGFVEMASDEEGQAAINELNGIELKDREIVVKVAKPRENGGGGGRGGYSGGGGGGGGYNRDRY